MEQKTMTMTDAFIALGLSPLLAYLVGAACFFLLLRRMGDQEGGLLLIVSMPYTAALALMGELRGYTLNLMLIIGLLSILGVFLPELIFGRDRYRAFLRKRIPAIAQRMVRRREDQRSQ